MKLKSNEIRAFLDRPDPGVAGVLISGEDGGEVAARRADLVLRLAGPAAEAEMRITHLTGAELRGDPAVALDALKATGFFPGPRVVLVDQATDGTAAALSAALGAWQPGDAVLVATAGELKPKGALRRLFEDARSAVAITLYGDPPGPEEIAALCRSAGIAQVAPDGRAALADLAAGLDAGAFRRLIETLGLFKRSDPAPLTASEVLALAPPQLGAETDALLMAVADGRMAEVPLLLARVLSEGTAGTRICIDGQRYFRQLLALASDPQGPESAAARMRPPIPFKLRDRMQRQARTLGAERIGRALAWLVETDLALRGTGRPPEAALVERTLIRIAGRGRD